MRLDNGNTVILHFELLPDEAARSFFVDGFKVASLMVVVTLMIGGVLAYFHRGFAASETA